MKQEYLYHPGACRHMPPSYSARLDEKGLIASDKRTRGRRDIFNAVCNRTVRDKGGGNNRGKIQIRRNAEVKGITKRRGQSILSRDLRREC